MHFLWLAYKYSKGGGENLFGQSKSHDQDGHYTIHHSIIFFSRTKIPTTLKPNMSHSSLTSIIVCANDNTRLTWTYVKARSIMDFYSNMCVL